MPGLDARLLRGRLLGKGSLGSPIGIVIGIKFPNCDNQLSLISRDSPEYNIFFAQLVTHFVSSTNYCISRTASIVDMNEGIHLDIDMISPL